MPIVTIQVTGQPVTQEQREELIARSTSMLQEVLGKNPESTFVIIEEVPTTHWGAGGKSVTHRFLKR